MKNILKKSVVVLLLISVLSFVMPFAMADRFTGYNCITTKEQLNNMRNSLGSKYYLGNDIVFTEADFAPGGAFYNDGKGWEPIGANGSNGFKGVFDGNGHTISGLQINASGQDTYFLGLFGYNQGDISNLTVKDIKITVANGKYVYAGDVAGATSKMSIRDCFVSGEITASGIKVQAVTGGITGGLYSGYIQDCFSSVKITVTDSASIVIGGIVGNCGGKIYTSGNTGSLYAKGRSDVFGGGICGMADSAEITITNVYNTGAVVVDSMCDCYVGGIAGKSKATVSMAFNSGVVSGRANTYEYKGRVLGKNEGVVMNAFYISDTEESGNGITGITAQQAANKSTFTDFDFDDVWTIADGIPVIKYFIDDVEDSTDVTTPVDPPQMDNDDNVADGPEGDGGVTNDPTASNPNANPGDNVQNDPGNAGQDDPFSNNAQDGTNPGNSEKIQWRWVLIVVIILILITLVIVLIVSRGVFSGITKK